MADWTERDVKQIREWNEKDHPRGQPDNAGQFAEKDSVAGKRVENQNSSSAQLPKMTTGGGTSITKSDYSSIRSEVIRKQSQRGYSKKRDYAYSANDFYVFNNGNEIGSFTIKAKFPIEGNEAYIDTIWRALDNE